MTLKGCDRTLSDDHQKRQFSAHCGGLALTTTPPPTSMHDTNVPSIVFPYERVYDKWSSLCVGVAGAWSSPTCLLCCGNTCRGDTELRQVASS